jgi:hypothetical protein
MGAIHDLLPFCPAARELNMNWIFVPVGAYATAVEWIESHGHTVFWCWIGSFIIAWYL